MELSSFYARVSVYNINNNVNSINTDIANIVSSQFLIE